MKQDLTKDKIKHLVLGTMIYILLVLFGRTSENALAITFTIGVAKEILDMTGLLALIPKLGFKKSGLDFLDIIATILVPTIIHIITLLV